MIRYWLGVVSRDHVRRAIGGGFCQANHGQEAPMKRLSKGDGVLYYSPRETMLGGAPIKAFVAIGRVADEAPYQVAQSEEFRPFRRQVTYFDATDAPIAPLLNALSFTRGGRNWGRVLRRGFFEIEPADYEAIAEAMGVSDDLKP